MMGKIRFLLVPALLAVFCCAANLQAKEEAAKPDVKKEEVKKDDTPHIQIAILLDTSGSMDGLIQQAKTRLWDIVNQFATAKQKGKVPKLEVALYEYGNDGQPAKNGHIRKILDLTGDLDKVSEQLFALTTNGGSEYCGWVIKDAINDLKWSDKPKDYKAIFIAGNEPFTQGPVDYKQSCKDAIAKGIIVNTIFCGDAQEGINTNWQDGSSLADGMFINIDQNAKLVHIEAPQDKEIAKLGQELNKTYVAFGKKGKKNAARQKDMDKKAGDIAPSNMAQRAKAKASQNYNNDEWDVIDAVNNKTTKIEDIKEEDLPEEMKKMTMDERKVYIDFKTKERKALQDKINKLYAERQKYVEEEMKKLSKEDGNTFDKAMKKAMKEQAEKREFELE